MALLRAERGNTDDTDDTDDTDGSQMSQMLSGESRLLSEILVGEHLYLWVRTG